MDHAALHRKTFLALLLVISLAFGWVLLPFYGAVFWGTVLALLFEPFYRQLLAGMRGRKNAAALATVLLTLVMVIFPLTVITAALVQEVTTLYQSIRTGKLSFGAYFQQVLDALPTWMLDLLNRFDVDNLWGLQEKLASAAAQGSQMIATRALTIGQNTFEFVISFGIMLYLLFFLLRDGRELSRKIMIAIPLSTEHKYKLLNKFTTVIRATVKGNILVAITQGTLGGIIFWILGIQASLVWGVVMAFLSLLPAIGAGLIWGPVAIYFLATGAVWEGIVLTLFGVLVIGLVDNILRPILVGKDTKMPDYVVLVSTLGGMALFGLNGFVIGPVIAALFISAWDLFASSQQDSSQSSEWD